MFDCIMNEYEITQSTIRHTTEELTGLDPNLWGAGPPSRLVLPLIHAGRLYIK
jgi:hypothetical protein